MAATAFRAYYRSSGRADVNTDEHVARTLRRLFVFALVKVRHVNYGGTSAGVDCALKAAFA